MNCPNCKTENRPSANFCKRCGQALPKSVQSTSRSHSSLPQASSSSHTPVGQMSQRDLDNYIFCMECGTKYFSDATQCNHCHTPATMPSPSTIEKLLRIVRSDVDKTQRLHAIQALGELKARRAIPLLLEFDHNRRGDESLQARLALTQVLDFSTSVVMCSQCGNYNPATAQFCHGCGARVKRPIITAEACNHLIDYVETSGKDFPLDAVQKLGQSQSQVAAAPLLALYKRYNRGFRDNLEPLLVLEALIDIDAPAAVDVAEKLAFKYHNLSIPATLKCHEALIRLGHRAQVLRSLRSYASVEREDTSGSNLRYVVQLGQFGEAEDISLLSSYIIQEKRRWNPGIGYLITTFDPISFLITTTFSVAANVINRVTMTRHGKSNAAWMVSTTDLIPTELKRFPVQVRKMIAMHCYSTALAELGKRYLTVLQGELQKCKKPLEYGVLGLALAQNGDHTVMVRLQTLCEDADWAVRILAYEGLITLSQTSQKVVRRSTYMRALQDRDIRVRIAIAKTLADAQDPTYVPPILAIVEADDKQQRQALVPIIAQLAAQGAQPALVKLQAFASGSQGEEVRNLAQTYLRGLQ